ncbi:hypothetical protein [Hyphomicrobium sp. 2TAF46]|uniref:hypothetical protein n=1 Tax=Hyphomicrobium sp. 2TAF46 TaxID=3233019 RepID=UPI003F91F4AA
MIPFRIDHSEVREKILGESIRSVASDLRLIDLPDLVSYLKTGQIANIGSLVQASIELSFKPETLTFGHAGDVHLEWGSLPRVFLDMEFHHQSVHVFFRLILEAEEAGVEITYIAFEGESSGPSQNTTRLHHALGEARLN